MSDRTARYRDALAIPHVLPTFGAALIGRSAYALVFLPLLYAVADATGSIALAGVAVALYGAGASFLAPVRAWLIDRHGARPVLGVLVLLFGGTIAALAITSLTSGPSALLMALAALAGAVAPPLGPTMRVAWGALAKDDALLRKGLSFDAVVEELLYLAGPAIAGLALALIAPGLALLVPAALVVVGGLLFVLTPPWGLCALDRAARKRQSVTGRCWRTAASSASCCPHWWPAASPAVSVWPFPSSSRTTEDRPRQASPSVYLPEVAQSAACYTER